MKQGKTIESLAAEVMRQNEAKFDLIASTTKLAMGVDEGRIKLHVVDTDYNYGVNDTAHINIATHTGIDKRYYDKMQINAPDLLALNVNHWFNANPENRMLRTLDGNARAMLSPRYRPLDNFNMMEVIVDEMLKMGGELIPVSCEVTERRMYMKFRYPSVSEEIVVGDIVEAGVVVSNSEIGYGKFEVGPYSYRLTCKNGAKHDIFNAKRAHIGRAFEDMDNAYALYADETRKADDLAFFMKVRDVFRAALNPEVFATIADQMREATQKKLTGSIEGAVTVLQKQNSLADSERGSILQHLIQGGDLSLYGLSQAVTRTAEDVDSYDRATELEQLGGNLLILPNNAWKQIAEAKPEDAIPVKRGRKAKAA